MNMSKLNTALDCDIKLWVWLITFVNCDWVVGFWNFFIFFEKLENSFRSGNSLLQNIWNVCNLHNRLCKLSYILHKSLNITDSQALTYCKITAKNTNSDITYIGNKVHNWLHNSRKKLWFPCGLIKLIIIFIKGFERFIFSAESFNNCMTAIHLFNMTVYIAEIFLLILKMLLRFLDYCDNKDKRNRCYAKCD